MQHAAIVEFVAWKPEIVVHQMMRVLEMDRVPEEHFIGINVRFVDLATAMLPCWMAEMAMDVIFPRPVPAAMQKANEVH